MDLAGRRTVRSRAWLKIGAFAAPVCLLAAACGGTTDAQDAPLPELELTSNTIDIESAMTSVPESTPVVTADARPVTASPAASIVVDQFGYRPGDPKVAVLVDPEVGFNAEVDFEPGEVIEVRNAADDSVVFTGQAVVWNDGEVHAQSGDRGWTFDFSSVREPGEYYVIDVDSGDQTHTFSIDQAVYDDVLKTALRVFWFSRGNTAHPESLGGPWSDAAAYVGPNQDSEARSVNAQDDASSVRDVQGGWFDAGDPNKYVTFASEPVHLLLTAFQTSPRVFDDSLDIPESDNGIPDIIDEVHWEIQWLERMQEDDGGVLAKVGVLDWGGVPVPSENFARRYYVDPCTSSTIAAAGMFAHAAVVFRGIPELTERADELEARAEAAWDWYQDRPKQENCDTGEVKAGDADLTAAEQAMSEVVAAVYLAALTNDDRYDEVVQRRFDSLTPFLADGFNTYRPHEGDALLFYRSWDGRDAGTRRAINERIGDLRRSSRLYGVDADADLYRAFMADESYHWGSNRVKANIGFSNLAVGGVDNGLERALAHLHYFHGVNPNGLVYLSNMEGFGAERSVSRLLHYWFGEGSIYDVDQGSKIGVAPGYVVGGPNHQYSGTAAPPANQPPQKSYRDWSSRGEPTWEITEPAIYYQASYIRLLAAILATES